MVANKTFSTIKVDVKGVKRLISRTNKIVGNLKYQTIKKTDKIMQEMKTEAQRIIRTETSGFGTLANGMIIKKEKSKQGKQMITNKWTLGFNDTVVNYAGQPYSKYVHDGFTPHWVKISNKPSLITWIEQNLAPKLTEKKIEHILRRDSLFIGGPNSAPWIKSGGVKFFDRAYKKIAGKARSEYNKTIKQAIRGK